jgi:hypothetical protein
VLPHPPPCHAHTESTVNCHGNVLRAELNDDVIEVDGTPTLVDAVG